MSGFRRRYGASPWHLVAVLLCFALSAYAVSRVFDSPALFKIAVWFLGAALVWDLVLGPAYALVDRLLRPLLRVAPRGVPALNHVRAPALISSLLLMVFLPLIAQRSEGVYRTKAGLDQDAYLGRWLAVTAVLFVLSGLVWAVRIARAARPADSPVRTGSDSS